MKKAIIFLLMFFAVLSIGNASELYQVFAPTFSAATPSSLYVAGAECSDMSCTGITSNGISLYNGDLFLNCWNTYKTDGDGNKLLTCIANTKISGNYVNLNSMSKIVIKESTDTSFGYVKQFFASEDSYLPINVRSQDYSCAYDICIDEEVKYINFVKKDNAVAEVGQLNIKNIDNPLLPVQVEVPVSIEETVCSAFRFVDSGAYRFTPPAGYSDYSADTAVNLKITNVNSGDKYLDQTITIPIEADTCAGLAAFSWTPSSDMENYDVLFRVETDVIDNQVVSSTRDWAEVKETIYPEDLSGTCWTRGYNLTLSNINSFDLTTSVAQITQGESLYTLFNSGAWMGEDSIPISYNINVQFNGQTVYQELANSGSDLSNTIINLSPYIKNLTPGFYTVKVITTPVNNACTSTPSVVQTQNLQILEPEKYDVKFTIRDHGYNLLENANINLRLISADDYYQTSPTYDQNLNTNSFGTLTFNDVVAGNYVYTISKDGYTTVSSDVHIASNKDIYVILSENNVAPTINLPTEFTKYYKESQEIDLRKYVNDYNDLFNTLSFTYSVKSGDAQVNKVVDNLIVSTTTPNDVVLEVTVSDPQGLTSKDETTIHFIANSAPVISSFYADPDNGEAPFNTNFYADVSDKDGDDLTCTIDFGDGTSEKFNCAQISHTFENVGTYNVKLTVNDGVNPVVEKIEQVFVFQREYSSPHINYFNIESSNDLILPTNIHLTWDAVHPDNLPMTCTLRINGVNHDVVCSHGSYDISNYNIEGVGRFALIAFDGTNQDLRQIERTFTNPEEHNHLPIINSFYADPKTGEESLTTTFHLSVFDEDGDDLTCTLKFGDGNEITDNCINLNNIKHTYDIGTYNPELIVTDGLDSSNRFTTVIVTESQNEAPIINRFYASPNEGINSLSTMFTIETVDLNDDDLICTLSFGDGEETTDNCERLNGIMHLYGVGNFVARLEVNDGRDTVSATTSIIVTEYNTIPVIESFTASPNEGVDTLETTFNIVATDEDGDNLLCNLDFGDGYQIANSCDVITSVSHLYNGVGNYAAILTVSDGVHIISSSTGLVVHVKGDVTPTINWFTMTSSNENVIPTNLLFDWSITDPNGLDLVCTLYINNESQNVPCIGNYEELNYNISGDAEFRIVGTNSLGLNSTRVITETFVRPGEYDLDLNELNLIIDKVIYPGEFDFTITTRNETLARREVSVEPIIICDSVENKLNKNLVATGVRSGLVSTSSREDNFEFKLKANTNDFMLKIPKDEECRFVAHVTDRYGTDFRLNANVIFKYPEVEHKIQSIRGKTTDILNYMSYALLNELRVGYNNIEFNLENNDDVDKEVVITVTSRELNFAQTVEVNLGSDQTRTVQIPLFIKKELKPGLYPIRFSVYDGSDKQIRYTYINVK